MILARESGSPHRPQTAAPIDENPPLALRDLAKK